MAWHLREADGTGSLVAAPVSWENFVDFGDHVEILCRAGVPRVVAEAEAPFDEGVLRIHVFHGMARFSLNAGYQFGSSLVRLRGFFRQLANFSATTAKPSVFPGASGFDGRR